MTGDVRFRPATLDDAALAADVATALRRDEREDPASWRHWWQSMEAWELDLPDWAQLLKEAS